MRLPHFAYDYIHTRDSVYNLENVPWAKHVKGVENSTTSLNRGTQNLPQRQGLGASQFVPPRQTTPPPRLRVVIPKRTHQLETTFSDPRA